MGIELAKRIAIEDLKGVDLPSILEKAGAIEIPGKGVLIQFLGSRRVVLIPEWEVLREDGEVEGERASVLILHYLKRASGAPLSGKEVDFRSLPGGISYIGPFTARCIKRLIRKFGNEIALLRKAALALGAEIIEGYGDLAFRIWALPRVPVKLVFWKGDEEFEPTANIIFDSSITEYLSTEDVVVLSELIVEELWKAVGK
jgi:hypothetical protein